FCDSNDLWLPLLCTMNVTVATELFRRLFGWDHAQLEREVASIPPGSDGLIFLPYLQGERTPNLPDGCGVLHGMNTGNTTPAHLARAAMEGVTLGMAYGLKRMESLGVTPEVIHLTGGGSQSAAWRQMCADIFGFPVVTMQTAEGAALGAAVQALATAEPGWNADQIAARCAPVDESSRVLPSERFDYAEQLQRQSALRERIF
ncbi:MAG: FGGY-family carbohydrate kinase, partial [Chthoniobacterales bacterium]